MKMLPIITKKMDIKGATLTRSGFQRAQPYNIAASFSAGGARCGLHQQRTIMYVIKRALMISPGRMPATSNSAMEILTMLTLLAIVAKITARLEGGMSISTPPTAMIGPIAMVG